MYTSLIGEIEVQPTPVTPNERSFGVDVRQTREDIFATV